MNRTYNLDAGATLFHADCRDALRALPDNSIDSGVMDPPYALVSIVKRFGSPNAAPAKGNDAYMRASAGFMGKTWDTGECAMDSDFWTEVLRVLKPGAHLVAFGASRGYHRMACAIEDAGFEIRDSLMWMYGTGFPKSHDVSKGIDKAAGLLGNRGQGFNVAGQNVRLNQNKELRSDHPDYQPYAPATPEAAEWEGWGTALKPAFEPIVLARKPLSEGTVAANVLRWRTGALNIDACRIEAVAGDAPVSWEAPRGGIWRTDAAAQSNLTVTGKGRWPANVCHDGSDDVVAGFPNNAARFFFNASDELCTQNNASDAELRFPQANELVGSVLKDAVERSTQQLALTSIDFPAPFTSVTPSELKQTSALLIETIQSIAKRCSRESLPARLTLSDNLVSIAAVCERIDTITITISLSKSNGSAAPVTFSITLTNLEVGAKDSAPSTARFHYSAKASKADRAGSKHPTVKPVALMEWLCALVTPPGGTVLDPFAGSGTTGVAARAKGFNVVLCERESEYVADILRRFGHVDSPSIVPEQHTHTPRSDNRTDRPQAVD